MTNFFLRALACLILCAASIVASAAEPRKSDRPIKFNRDIRPILSETCFHCHGPDEHGRKADLRLDSLEGATADLDGTVAIVPGIFRKVKPGGALFLRMMTNSCLLLNRTWC